MTIPNLIPNPNPSFCASPTATTPVEKRRPGRPLGSTTTNHKCPMCYQLRRRIEAEKLAATIIEPRLLTVAQASSYLGLQPGTLANWRRRKNIGPKAHQAGLWLRSLFES